MGGPGDGGHRAAVAHRGLRGHGGQRAEGRITEADQIAKISRQPQGIWLTSDVGAVEQEARSVAQGAADADRTPVVVLYDLPHR